MPLVPKAANDKDEHTRADGSYHEIRLRMKLRVHNAGECRGPLQPIVVRTHFLQSFRFACIAYKNIETNVSPKSNPQSHKTDRVALQITEKLQLENRHKNSHYTQNQYCKQTPNGLRIITTNEIETGIQTRNAHSLHRVPQTSHPCTLHKVKESS